MVETATKLVYRVAEAMWVTGLNRNKVYELIRSGELPSYTVGSARYIPADGLREWVRKQTPQSRVDEALWQTHPAHV